MPPTPTPAAKQPVTADDVNSIAKQMYCPVCENEPLDACRTAACQQWRAQIGQMLSEGQTEQQIKDYFVSRYGARVLAQPPARELRCVVRAADRGPDRRRGDRGVAAAPAARARNSSGCCDGGSFQPTGDAYTDRVEKDLKNW